MEKEITDKLETLLKYIPFIDFVLKIDKEKYVKFIDIRKWIIIKKRYPLSDLNKIEQSIITQYKNLLLVDDNKIPREIMNIFNTEIKHQFVNLCSDDEEEHTEPAKYKSRKEKKTVEKKIKTLKEKIEKTEAKLNKIIHTEEKKSKSSDKQKNNDQSHQKLSTSLKNKKNDDQKTDANDSEDDLEIVSVVYLNKQKVEQQEESKKQKPSATKSCDKNKPKDILNLDDVSEELLRKIDILNEDDNKNTNFHEPINYNKHSDDEDNYEIKLENKVKQENLYQRRKSEDILFKRRDDFKDLDCVKVKETKQKESKTSLDNKNRNNKSPTNLLETISLDSSSASEGEEESLSNKPTTSAKALAALKKLNVNDKIATCNLKTLATNNIVVNEDLNGNNLTAITNNLETLNSTKSIGDTQTETLQTSIDHAVLCRTEPSLDISLVNDTKANKDCQTNSKQCMNAESPMGLLDMDIDTENDLNDVLNEINNPADLNLTTTTDIISDTRLLYRNASPPPLPTTTAASIDINSKNKENLTTSSDLTNTSDSTKFRILSQDQLCKIFEDIESRSDVEIDNILQALASIANNVNQNIAPKSTIGTKAITIQNELTPPAPHFNATTPQHSQHYLEPQLQQQPIFYANPLTPSFIPPPQTVYQHPNQQYLQQHQQAIVVPPSHQYNGTQNLIPTTSMPGMEPFPRINLKDPRIIRKLKMIQDSPLWNEFNRKKAEMLTNAVCRNYSQQNFPLTTFQQQYSQPVTNIPVGGTTTPALINNRRKSTTKSTINFGEYKRRQMEQQQELERKREEEKKRKEEELKAKKEQELKEIEMRELLNSTNQIRSILLSTLEPYKDKLNTIWGQHCNNPSSSNATTTTTQQSAKETPKTSKQTEVNKTKDINDNNSQNEKKKIQDKSNDRINRVYKELECTVKGFDQIQDYLPKSIGGRRRSSVHARSSISEQLNSNLSDDCTDEGRLEGEDYTPKPIGARRRSSVHARTSIAEQLNSHQAGTDERHEQDNTPRSIDGRRRSSVHARSSIAEQLNSQLADDCTNERRSSVSKNINNLDTNIADVPKLIGGKRRSSINARLAIVEQLNELQQTTDHSDSSDYNSSQNYREMPKLVAAKRKSSTLARSAITEQLQQQQTLTDYSDSSDINSTSIDDRRAKRMKSIDEPIHAKRRNKNFILQDNSTCDSSSEEEGDFEKFRLAKLQRLKEDIIKNPPTVVLERISPNFIRKHTTKSAAVLTSRNVLNVHLVESKARPSIIEKTPPVQKIVKPKKCNNDSQMTERNSKFCALCTSKPSDLTNHYKRKHKTESYVSRLTWSQLEDLAFNTPFAKLQPKNLNSRIDRYQVDCPFCAQHLLEPFMSLYNHYSTHTGEYAYRCSHCQLERPYRADVQSHQLHSKTCRNNNIQVLYRYPPNAQCIYLHYCTICNFVQLNEANILKHLREHHDPRKAIAQNVQKCILAAISDAPDVSDKQWEENNQNIIQQTLNNKQDHNTQNMVTPLLSTIKKTETMDFKVNDDDIPVSNEACSQDIFEDGKFSLEEQLKQMHEEETPPANITPMTVIHCGNSPANINQIFTSKSNANVPPPISSPAANTNTLKKVIPMKIKVEAMDVDENVLITPPRPSAVKLKAMKDNSVTLNNNQNAAPTALTTIKEQSQTIAPIGCSSSAKVYSNYEKYHNYPANVNYMGLYKCMADDCYYSTDSSDEILKHLDDHSQDSLPSEYLQCPYCIIPANVQITALHLIEHIRSQHQHMIYQCSICCYRSCEASNVLVHQEHSHVTGLNATIYKCFGTEINFIEKELYIKDKVMENVRKIACPYCTKTSFYNSNLVLQHLSQDHKICGADVKVYSCIYCPFMRDQNSIRKHLANKHPEELPCIYDHNTTFEIAQDPLINIFNILNVSQPVSYLDVNRPICENGEKEPEKDVKPELDDLIKMNEDTVKVRLRKLTAHTGVPPDSLYRCPEPSCGGFFSIFDLWLKHMRIRHHSMECPCPHCPSKHPCPLESYAVHFEEHRRHTFICFYCSTTSRNEVLAKQHATEHHSNFAEMRLEQIRVNVNYSYFIMIQAGLFTERAEFISEFLAVLDKRLMDLKSIKVQNLKHQWLIQPNTAWVEDVPNINRRVIRKCLDQTCKFRSVNDDLLFQHMNTIHGTYRAQFNCQKCDHKIVCNNNWKDIFEHRKLHSDDSIFICVACRCSTPNRSKLADHIRDVHAARDVPVIEHIKTRQGTKFMKLAVVFANNHLTFSTIRNCFCCDEKNMNGDVFNLHLRRYHKLSLNYFCEWCINTQFKSLEEVASHFQRMHPTATTKIRCQLAFNGEIIVTALDVFQLQIFNKDQKVPIVEVKQEPCDEPDYDSNDDDVVILEEDDIVIQESLKNHEEVEKPQLKCVSMNNLLQAQCIQPSLSTPPTISNPSVIQVPPPYAVTSPATSTFNNSQNYTTNVISYVSNAHNSPSTFNTHSNVKPGNSIQQVTNTNNNANNNLKTLNNPNTIRTTIHSNYTSTVPSYVTPNNIRQYNNVQNSTRRIMYTSPIVGDNGSYVRTSVPNHNLSTPILYTCSSSGPTSSHVTHTSTIQ